MIVEQVLIFTIILQRKAQKTVKQVTHKAGGDNFSIGSLIFFLPNSVSNVCMLCFAILSSNVSGRTMHLLRHFMHLLTFTVNKTSSVSRDAVLALLAKSR